jgi:hypothetical protein
VHLGGAERDQPRDLGRLVLGVQVEVDARRDLDRRAHPVERHVRPDAIPRSHQDEVDGRVARILARDVAERGSPERRLERQVVDAETIDRHAHRGHCRGGATASSRSCVGPSASPHSRGMDRRSALVLLIVFGTACSLPASS